MFKRLFRYIFRAIITIIALLVLYLSASVVGALWTSSPQVLSQNEPTYQIYVTTNGFHSDIIIPYDDDLVKMLPIQAVDFPDHLINAKHLIIGWGAQTAYTSLLELTDMSPRILVKSLFFDQSVVHVQPFQRDLKESTLQEITLSRTQMENMISFINQTFAYNSNKSPILLEGVSHGHGDIFYRGEKRYHLLYSCNVWTGEALRHAGVVMGYWTPFAQSIEWGVSQHFKN